MDDWDIFEEFEKMRHDFDRLFGRVLGNYPAIVRRPANMMGVAASNALAPFNNQSFRLPVTHMCETENAIIAAVELPGMDKQDIKVNVEGNLIEISAEKKKETKIKTGDKKERNGQVYTVSSSKFYKRIGLPDDVNPEKADAKYTNGVLRIEVPKKEQKKDKGRSLDIQ